MADVPQFKTDPTYKSHYMHHRLALPRFVKSKAEHDFLLARKWTIPYQYQAWPQTRYHKDYSIDVERAPDVVEFFKPNGEVDEPGRQKAITARNKQRQRAVRLVANEQQIAALGPDWLPYHELPSEKARLAQEAADNAADAALYGGDTLDDPFAADAEEPLMVVGEPLRRGRKSVAI